MNAASTLRAPMLALPARSGRVLAVVTAVVALLASGTGFGATSADVDVDAAVLSMISLADPTGLDASPAPTNGAAWTNGSPNVLHLGELSGSEVATASATWAVTTTNPLGYTLTMTNPAAAPVMKSGANTVADMGAVPAPLSTSSSAFGVAVGDAVGHSQAAASFAGSPWGTTGGAGTQGTLYRGVPSGSAVEVGRSNTAETNDPLTLNFAAVSSSSNLPAPGAYTGQVTLTATTL